MTEAAFRPMSNAPPLNRVLTFALANLPIAAISIAVFVYLPPYFAGHLGVSLSVVGASWFAVRMIDVPVDVCLALFMDRTRTAIGRYRPWMIAGAPILMLGIHQLFAAPHGFGPAYLIGWLLVMYVGYSILYLSLTAWAATLAPQYHQRSQVFGVITAVGVVGALGVLLIPILGQSFGRSNAQSVQTMGWLIVCSIPVVVAIATLRTPERVARDQASPAFRPRDYWEVFTKPDLVRLFLSQMALTLGPGWMSAVYIFFFTDAWGFTLPQASILLAVYIVSQLPGAIGTAALARRIGKHRTLMVTTTAFSLGILSIFLTPKANLLAAVPIMVWSGAMASGFGLMIQAMIGDVSDEIRLSQGKDRTSLLYAVNALAQKIAAAISIGATLPLLQALGFHAADGAVNSPAALNNLTAAFIGGPIVFVMLGGACVIGWRLDAATHDVIRGALAARDAALEAVGDTP